MRRAVRWVLVLGLAACRPPALVPPPGPVPAVADRPAGFACHQQTPTRVDPAQLFAEATAALRRLGLRPVRLDPAAHHFTLAGPTAPQATGSPAQQAVHLYLDWRILPASDSTDGPHTVHIAPGVSNLPPGLSEMERTDVYRQGSALAARLAAAIPSLPPTTRACYAEGAAGT